MSTAVTFETPTIRICFDNAEEMFGFSELDAGWDKIRDEFPDLDDFFCGGDGPAFRFMDMFDEYVNKHSPSISNADNSDWNGSSDFWLEFDDATEKELAELAAEFQSLTFAEALSIAKLELEKDSDGQFCISAYDNKGELINDAYGHYDANPDDDEEDEENDEPVQTAPVGENSFAIDLNLDRPAFALTSAVTTTTYQTEEQVRAVAAAQWLAEQLGVPLEISF